MSDKIFDAKTIMETYRSAFAPLLKAQQEGVKVLDRAGRYQYAIAGDYLEWSLAQAKLAITAQSPADFFSKQVELTTALSEKLRARAQEFAALATEAQASFTDAVKETTSHVVDTTIKAADEAKKFADEAKTLADVKTFAEPKKKVG